MPPQSRRQFQVKLRSAGLLSEQPVAGQFNSASGKSERIFDHAPAPQTLRGRKIRTGALRTIVDERGAYCGNRIFRLAPPGVNARDGQHPLRVSIGQLVQLAVTGKRVFPAQQPFLQLRALAP